MNPDDEQTRRPDLSEAPTLVPDLELTVRKVWGDVAEDAEASEVTLKAQIQLDSERTLIVADSSLQAVRAGMEEQLDDFQILDVIGEGGMGVVYNARQVSLDREVALKILKDVGGRSREAIESSFTSEAIVTGDLDHPNIVPVHTLGHDAQGKAFYTMKKVSGRSWKDGMGEMSLDENLEVLLRVCDAVAFAHARGIIHRDLKPDNVMLGDFGEVVVMDWGLAASVAPGSKIEKHGAAISFGGTPAYMAPEMAVDRRDQVGTCSDVYLLGGILYRIVTGLSPHRAETPVECIVAAAQNRIEPTDKEGELIEIALKAMSAKPEDRYQNVDALQSALRDYRAHSQSIRLSEDAERLHKGACESRDYDEFARAIFGFEAAISLWADNQEARKGLTQGRIDYAQNAYQKGDFDLALSLLDEDLRAHDPLREKILFAREERVRRQKHLRGLKIAAVALSTLLGISLTVGFFWIRAERNTAVREGYFTKIGLAANKIEDLRFDKAEELLAGCPESLRHWEWARLAYLCNSALITFSGHASRVETVAFSPDGSRVASGDQAGNINIWSAATGRLQSTLRGHADVITSLAFSPDGALLASGSGDSSVKLWDAETGTEMGALEGHSEGVSCLVFSSDAKTVVSGGGDRTIRRWDVTTETEVLQLKDPSGPITSVALSPDDRFLAWGAGELGEPGRIGLINLETGSQHVAMEGHADRVNCVAFSPDGRQLASGGWDGAVLVWDFQAGRLLAALTGHDGAVHSVAYSPGGNWLASCSDDSTIKQWDPGSGMEMRTFRGHSGAVRDIAISRDGRLIASASIDGTVKLWDAEQDSPETLTLMGHAGAVTSVDFSSDGTRLVSGSQDGAVKLWELPAGDNVNTLAGEGDTIMSVDFSPDDTLIASGNWDRTVTVWDARTGHVEAVLEGHTEPVRSVQFSPDGKMIASGGWDHTVRVWDVESAKALFCLRGHTEPVQCVAFSPDGAQLASCGRDNTVRIWSVETRSQTAILTGHEHWVRAVAYSPNGSLLASAGDDNVIRIWNARKGRLIATLKGHTNSVKSVAFSPDGRRLISAGDDAVVRIWAVGTWNEVLTLTEHAKWIWSVAFSPDGRRIAAGAGDGTINVWDAGEKVR